MFMLKRLAFAAMMLGVLSAGAAQAANYSLTGGGAQLHIGGGLPLPIQPAFGGGGTALPPLLIPPVATVTIMGTTAMASQQRIFVPKGALSKSAAQLTLGVFNSNPTLYAVATNLAYTWPTKAAVFSTGARTGATTTTIGAAAGFIRYSNPSGKFGGPAQFRLTPGPAAGIIAAAPVTLYAIAFAAAGLGAPPCTHTALTPVPFPGTFAAAECVAALAGLIPSGPQAIGAATGVIVSTPGGIPGAPAPGVGIGKFTAGGGIAFFTFTPAGNPGFTNMAVSEGFPWTTGMITLSAPAAKGGAEVWMITGKDTRTAGGGGTIQMVSGSLSTRVLTGDNANRGWVQLTLLPTGTASAMGPIGIAMAASLMGYLLYRRQHARTAA